MKSKNPKTAALVKSAAIIAIGSFAAKMIGAVYRVPLTNLLGSYGLGVYQMVFPVYGMLLTLSGASVPTVLSKLVAEREEEEGKRMLRAALTLLPAIGFFFALLMAIFSRPLARLQGNADARYCYLALAPSVFFVSTFASIRGYFQGKMNMLPTALSQLVEQVVKLGVGLFFAHALLPSPVKAAAGATLGVSVSEGAAALFLFFFYRKRCGKLPRLSLSSQTPYLQTLLKSLLPVVFIGILPPLSGVISGFYTIPLLSRRAANATAQYGAYFGGVTSVVGVPVALCYGIAVAALPILAKNKSTPPLSKTGQNTSNPLWGNTQSVTAPPVPKGEESLLSSYRLTLFIALPACAFLAFFALPVSRLLFFQLSLQEVALSARLLRLSSLQIPLLSIVQTGNAVLISQGKARRSAFALGISCLVEVFLSFFLLLQGIGIFSLPISAIVGYFVATFFNLVYSMKGKTIGKARKRFALQTAAQAFAAFFSAAVGKAASAVLKSPLFHLLLGFSVTAGVYLLLHAAVFFCKKTLLRKLQKG